MDDSNTDGSLRVKLTALLSTRGGDLDRAEALIARGLTQSFGGAYFGRGQGYWSPTGDRVEGPYAVESLPPEQGLRIELLVMPESRERALDELQRLCRQANEAFGLGCHWLHVEEHVCHARHCEIDVWRPD